MKQIVTILPVILGLLLSQAAFAQQDAARVQTLRGTGAAVTDKAPPERPYAGQFPGSQKPLARTYSTQPPLIPHSIEGIDATTLKENACLACHGPENYKNVKAPKLSDTHFTDRDGKMHAEVSRARWQCTTCHVPQVDAKPLVENTFRGDLVKKK